MATMNVAVLALLAPLALAKPLSRSHHTSNTFTNTTLEDMPATDLASPTPTDSDLGCFETYVPLPYETCGDLASDFGIFLSSFEADYAADSDFCETMLYGQGFCASREEEYTGTSIVYADATVTLDDQGNPAVGPAVTQAPREAREPLTTETTITFSAMTTLTYTIGTGEAKQERTKVVTHTDVQVETFSILNAAAVTAAPSAASAGTIGQLDANMTTVTVHDTETLLTTTTLLANASSTLTAHRTLKGTPFATTRHVAEATLKAENVYTSYNGNGTVAEGWPSEDQWLSFEQLFENNKQQMDDSCDAWEVDRNSPEEISSIEDSILDVSNTTGVDSRFILATIMQSSAGCVRAVSTHPSYLASGLMQSPNGANTCNQSPSMLSSLSDNSNATSGALDPCPPPKIHQMILEGTNGTDTREGLAQLLAKPGPDDVSRYYRAARWYNGGGIDPSGDLGKGCCMASFASDIANRLTGWVGWDREFVDADDASEA
ncbi:hypothetical protein Q7P37_005349 [Cladosporium fusiforme]